MTYLIILGVLVVVVLAFFVLRRGGGGSRFPRVPEGEVVGTWSFVANPETKTVAWDLKLPDEIAADFVPHFVQWQLFYFGNGSAQHDTSGALRAAIQGLLEGATDCVWTPSSEVARGGGTLDFQGEFLHPGGFANYPGVIGVPRKAESLEGATLVLLQQGLAGPHADRVRRSVSRLLQWHAELGPAPSMKEIAPRAFASLQEPQGTQP